MTSPSRICVSSGASAGIGGEVEQRVRALGLECVALPVSASLAAKQQLLAQCDVLISVFPEDRDAHLCLGLAAGAGLRLLVLSAERDASAYPAGAKVFATLHDLMSSSAFDEPGQPPRQFISEQTLRDFNACEDGVAWFTGRYPDGGHSKDWTADEQLEVLKAGGGQWLQTIFERGLVRQWAMTGATLADARLERLRLTAPILSGADLRRAVLDDAQLREPKLDGADLEGASLKRAVFRYGDLSGAKLVAAELGSALLLGVKLDGADLGDAGLEVAQLRRGSARKTRFVGARMGGATFADADIAGADFTRADLGGAHFTRCRLEGAIFASASLCGASFIDCDHHSADLAQADLTDAYLKRAVVA
jgi:uncharacterized protein YjbI with pentapeptide repeats